MYNSKNYYYFNNIYFKYFIIFYLVCLASSLISDYKLISSIKSFFYFRFGIFALAVWYLLSKNKLLTKYIFLSLLFCFIILIFDGFVQYFYGKNIIGIEKQGVRLSSFFGKELILGSYLSRILPILIGIFSNKLFKKKFKSLLIYNVGNFNSYFNLFNRRKSGFFSYNYVNYILNCNDK